MKFKHLLKTTALTLLLIIAGKVGWGQIITTENFNYADNALLTANGWVAHSGGGTQAIDVGASNGLTYTGYSGLTGITAAIEGNAARLDNNGEDDSKIFTAVTSGTIYYSFLVNVTSSTTGYFLNLGGSASLFATRIWVKPSVNVPKINFGISNGSTALYAATPTDFDLNTTYLIIVKYAVSAAGDASLWVKSSGIPATEVAAGTPEHTITGSGQVSIDRICLRQYSATQGQIIDGIRVGVNYEDVIDLTPPTLSSITPADEGTGVALTPNLTLNFNENITKGTGNIIIKKLSDDSVIETIDVTTSAVVISNSTATVTLTSTLGFNTGYYITIDATAIKDLANNNFAGISNNSTWNFTTRAIYTTATVSSIDYTINNEPTWTISNIPSGVSKATFEGKLTPAAGATIATFEADGTTPATGNVLNGYKLKVTAEDGTTTNIYTMVVTPALIAATSNNNVDNSFDITFTDDATWRAAITTVKDDATTLTSPADYTIASGKITLIPASTNTLKVSGSRTITIVATGYADATVTQLINPGIFNHATISNAPAMGLGATSTVTLTAKDQFENLVSGYVFKYDVTITNTTATTTESYTIDGTARTASISDVDVTATNASGVATFDIAVPAVVDGDDGISVQVQLNNGTTNLGSALSYIAPTTPTLTISATPSLTELNLNGATITLTLQNETFADATLDKANFTLNNAPTNTTVSDVTYNSATSATVTLTYDGTDFDSNVTNVSVTIAGSELTLTSPLTSNNLTINAIVEIAPTVTTDAAITTNGSTTATWGGNVTDDGGEVVTEKGICWSTSANPTIANNKAVDATIGNIITGNMTNLTPNTLYYVKTYATNSEGTGYGDEKSFTTLLSSAKAITATTIGSIDEANKKVIDVPGATTVAELKAALTVSTNATPEIYTAAVGTTVATGTIVLSTVKGYVIRVTAQDASTQEYGIGMLSVAKTIHEIQYTSDASGDSPLLSQIVKFKGVVTAIKGGTYQSIYVQNGVGEWNAVYAYSIPTTTTVATGDSVSIVGYVKEYNKLTEIDPVYSITIINSNNTVPEAIDITTQNANSEAFESVLIRVQGATCSSSTSGTCVVSDGSGNLTAFKSLYPDLALIVGNKYNITGVMTWYNTSSLWELYPRNASDVSNVTGINNNLNSNLSIYPNPFSNEIRFEGSQSVKRVVITSITGQVLKNVEIGQVNSVNTQDLPRGMYLVTFMNSKGEKTTQKMVKE